MDETANLSLPYIMPQQAQKYVTHNEALRDLDSIVQLAVLDRDLATPPPTPADGDRYIVAAAATGAWAGQSGNLAAYQDGGWLFYAPRNGWRVWIEDEALLLAWSGTAWIIAGGQSINPAPMIGVLATADTTNRLSVKSDAALFADDDITPGSGDMRISVSKASAGKDAGFVLQDGFSTRAIVGLLGDDNFSIKTSADGSTFHPALNLDNGTGHAGIGTTADSSNALSVAGASALLANAAGDFRLTLGKAAAANTVSLLLEDNYSGRAELGLSGDDDFHLKVSPDGTTWTEALHVGASDARVGIGTITPTARLTVTNNSGTLPAGPTGTILHVAGADSSAGRILMDCFGDNTVSPNISFRHARGTAASPSALKANDQILNAASFGYGATSYSSMTRGGFVISAAEDWTDTAQGTSFSMSYTAIGTTTLTQGLLIDPHGNIGLSNASPARRVHALQDDAVNNDVAELLRLTHTTSGTAAIGIGAGIEFEVETATGNNKEIGMRLDTVTTNVTGAAENFDLVVSLMAGGATASEAFRVKAGGKMSLPGGSFSSNGSVATALSSVGPTGAHTSVQKWLVIDDAGTARYVPCF